MALEHIGWSNPSHWMRLQSPLFAGLKGDLDDVFPS